MLTTAGFDRVDERGRFKLGAREGWSVRHVVLNAAQGPSQLARPARFELATSASGGRRSIH